jgi:hypothetical protein
MKTGKLIYPSDSYHTLEADTGRNNPLGCDCDGPCGWLWGPLGCCAVSPPLPGPLSARSIAS